LKNPIIFQETEGRSDKNFKIEGEQINKKEKKSKIFRLAEFEVNT